MFNKTTAAFHLIKYMWRLRKARKSKRAFDNGYSWATSMLDEGNDTPVTNALDTAVAFGFDSFDQGVKRATQDYEKRKQAGA